MGRICANCGQGSRPRWEDSSQAAVLGGGTLVPCYMDPSQEAALCSVSELPFVSSSPGALGHVASLLWTSVFPSVER